MSSKLRGCTPGAEKVCPAVMLLQAHRILYIYDRVNLDVAKARESVSAGVEGLDSRGRQARIKLATIYSLPGTKATTDPNHESVITTDSHFVPLASTPCCR